MDKKNLTLGIVFIVAAFATLIIGARLQPPPAAPAAPTASSAPGAPSATAPAGSAGSPAAPATSLAAPVVPNTTLAALAENRADAKHTLLTNEFVTVRLTDFGGAITDVAFKKYPAVQGSPESFVFNQQHAAPLLGIGELAGLDQNTRFTLVPSASANEVVYRAIFENRLEVTRRYVLPAGPDKTSDPYRIRHETTIRNLTDTTIPLPRLVLELGTSTLVSGNDTGLYLNVVTNDGDDTEFTDRADFAPSFFSRFGFGSPVAKSQIEQVRPVVWAAVTNQFFTTIYTADAPGQSVAIRRVDLPPLAGSSQTNTGITAVARFDQPALAPKASHSHVGHLYVGPKEYTRLANSDLFKHREDKVMHFERFPNNIFFSGIVAPILNKLMVGTHAFVGNWGVAIVLMTLLLKFISVPFTLAASKSAKRMAKIAEPMKAIREKYKDNPKKLQEATMALFREHKVNPAGGCIPILITIPLFVGFFAMLQGTAELRFQPFLWAFDLSAPDTVWRVPGLGLPLNIMPLLMGATMIFQMRLTPQPATMEGPQVMIMKIMPWIFTLICYNFAAALALYSTINGLFTIVQQLLVNKFSKDEPVAVTAVPAGPRSGKAVKNVTPSKK